MFKSSSMIDYTTILSASIVSAAGIMSPGPNFVAVTHRAVSTTRAEALALVLGIACVSALWASAVLFGINAVFTLFPWLFWVVKLFGAGYLIWFGVQLLRKSGHALPEKPNTVSRSNVFKSFRSGFITNLSNPKAMVFYASVFSSVIPHNATQSTLVTMIVAVAAISLSWYGIVALVLSGNNAAKLYRRGKPLIERLSGGLLVVFGLRQALAKTN